MSILDIFIQSVFLQLLLITYDDEHVNIIQKRADSDSSLLKIIERGLLEELAV